MSITMETDFRVEALREVAANWGAPEFVEVPEPTDGALQAAACMHRKAFCTRAGHKVLTMPGARPKNKNVKRVLGADVDRQVMLKLKTAWRDGTPHQVT